ncbi:MAG: KUP/HAK/KT family potassium transporter [Flavobacteriales bacterium]
MGREHHQPGINKLTLGGVLISLGIIYGDIGTSPLYVFNAIVGERTINELLILGGLSCVFWTLTLQTTLKYIILTLRADNKGEGGIFSLYNLAKHTKVKWLYIPALIGGAALLGEGIITPAISVSSAIEGIKDKFPEINTLPIILAILVSLFAIQQFGTNFIGRSFGPVMLLWFGMLAVLGANQLIQNPLVLKAINPTYAYELLAQYPKGFWILGAVFLCTTGAEALYSDLGHCGRKNIRVSWIFVKTALLLNYFGQGAWLITQQGRTLQNDERIFYAIMPEWFFYIGLVIATVATIVASQALITGSFTLVNEAMRLNFWPKIKINYPTPLKGQLYIPSINWFLLLGTSTVVLLFRTSSNMEAAYGLTIIIGMMMTSILLVYYMLMKQYKIFWVIGFVMLYSIIESSFLVANMSKLLEGAWFSILVASLIFSLMWVWREAKRISYRYVEFTKIEPYLQQICELKRDISVPKNATHLVFLTNSSISDLVESKIIYSIFQKQPKRADVYWLLHVHVLDEPYTAEYRVKELSKETIFRIDFYLGFRVAPKINVMFRKVVEEMVKNHEVDITSRYVSLNKNQIIGDFKFVVLEKYLSNENDLPVYEKIIMDLYFMLKYLSISEDKAFGLDTSNVQVEKFPLIINAVNPIALKRKEKKG